MFFDSYDTPVFRPPSEARSFILRVTRGCAHNKCKYCNMYEGVQFQVLTEEEVDRQIMMAANFNKRGVRRVFLADGDALVLSTERLLAILKKLRETFPNFEQNSILVHFKTDRKGLLFNERMDMHMKEVMLRNK